MRIRAGSVPEFTYSCLRFCVMVFIDLLQTPFQRLQFRPPFPLQPANGLRHSGFVSPPQPLAPPAPPRRGAGIQPFHPRHQVGFGCLQRPTEPPEAGAEVANGWQWL